MSHEQQEPPQDEPTSGNPFPDLRVGDIYEIDHQPGQPPEIRKVADDPPRIWVGSWLDYNNGVLHGDWIEADQEEAEIWADIQAILDGSPTAAETGEAAEDWGIFDYDSFGSVKIGEQEAVSYVSAIARGIAEHGPAFAAWADLIEDQTQLDGFTDAYLGEHDSIEAYAEDQLDELGYNQMLDAQLPEHIRRYVEFNIAGLARDLWLSGDVMICHRPDGGVWLFRSE
jgi:antirestriction protein